MTHENVAPESIATKLHTDLKVASAIGPIRMALEEIPISMCLLDGEIILMTYDKLKDEGSGQVVTSYEAVEFLAPQDSDPSQIEAVSAQLAGLIRKDLEEGSI